MRRSLRALLAFLLAAVLQANAQTVKVGSKRFTESYILGEILARATGGEHKPGLGNTGIVAAALKAGATAGRASSRRTVCRKRRAASTTASRMKRSPPASST